MDVLHSVTKLNRTHMFERYVVWCNSKDGYQKDVDFEEIGLRVQNVITILGLTIDVTGRAYVTI